MGNYCPECDTRNGPHKKECRFYPREAKIRDTEIADLQSQLTDKTEECERLRGLLADERNKWHKQINDDDQEIKRLRHALKGGD